MTATTPMATPDTIPWFSSMVSTIFVKQPSKAYLNNVMICLIVLFKTVNDVKKMSYVSSQVGPVGVVFRQV